MRGGWTHASSALALHRNEKRQTSEAGVTQDEGENAPAQLPRLRRRRTWMAAHRVDLNVYYRRMEREEFQTLAAIRDGQALGEALDAGFIGSRLPETRRPARVREWFATWAELGWVCAPDLETLCASQR